MIYGLADVVQQRRLIDQSPSGEEHKRAAAEALRFPRGNTVLSVRFENDAVVSASVVRNGDPTPVAA